MLGNQKNWNGWRSARTANNKFSGCGRGAPFFPCFARGKPPALSPDRGGSTKPVKTSKKEKVLLEISLEVPMSYGRLSLGCTWYDYDTAKSQQAKPAPSHQQRWFGTERCLCLCIPRLHRLTECRQSHSRVRPPSSVVAT